MTGRKIRVLQLGSAKGLYGAERWILALVRNLDPERFETHVATIRDEEGLESPVCAAAEQFGAKTRVFESRGRLSLRAVSDLREHIRREQIGIVHTHGYKTDIVGLLATAGTSCRILSTPHGWTQAPDPKLRIYEWIDRAVFPFMDAVVPLSDDLHRNLARIPGLKSRLHLIGNGVDMAEIEEVRTVSPDIARLRRSPEDVVIGYVGRLVHGKGLDVLLQAVAIHGSPSWLVALVGEGEQEGELRALAASLGIAERVRFFGFREDRIELMNGFDIFALPSRSEGIPRCLMEAMTARIPVVATDIPGCRHLVDGEVTGLLFPVDRPDALAAAITRLLSDPELRRKTTGNGYRHIRDHYSAEKMASRYEELYRSIAG